jgi:hypothetical protein
VTQESTIEIFLKIFCHVKLMTFFSHRPRPSLSWPKPTSMAWASILGGLGLEKLSLTSSFQAEPSRHNTINDDRDHLQFEAKSTWHVHILQLHAAK